MKINLNLDKDFENCIRLLSKKNEKLVKLNGFSSEQLNYTSFIDNFVDKSSNVADASIDGNANVGAKDAVSLINEMSKPHLKLLSFNKIFYEMKKKYGLPRAK